MERARCTNLGLELVYDRAGPDDAPAVVLLHGLLDTREAMRPIAEALADRWRVLVPDQRGHGESDRVGAGGYYHFPDYVLDLDALLRHERLERAHLVGHSMGASVACYFAGSFPERVASLVGLDGIGPPTEGDGPDEAARRMRRWVEGVRRNERYVPRGAESLDELAERLGRSSPRASRQRLHELVRVAAEQGADGLWRWRFDPLHRTRIPIGFDAVRFRGFLARIDAPVHLLWAEESPMHAPDEAERLACLDRVTEETLPDTGHNLHHERPEATAAAVRRFLEASEPAEATP